MAKTRNNEEDWALNITRTNNGYLIESTDYDSEGNAITRKHVIQDCEQNELKSHRELLWEVMEFFNFQGSKHDNERIRIIVENHDGTTKED